MDKDGDYGGIDAFMDGWMDVQMKLGTFGGLHNVFF